MEPPSKKPRLSPRLPDQEDDELTLNLEDLALDRQFQRSQFLSACSFKSRLEGIFEKYGKDFADEGDEIDLNTGEIVVDKGHFRAILGGKLPIFASNVDGNVPEDQEDEGVDLNDLYSDDEEGEGEGEGEGEEGEEEGSINLEDGNESDQEDNRPSMIGGLGEPPDTAISIRGGLESAAVPASASLLGALNRLMGQFKQSHGAASPCFDPLSFTNDLVEPAWRVPALPPMALEQNAKSNTKSKIPSLAKSTVQRRRRPCRSDDQESEDEITTGALGIGPARRQPLPVLALQDGPETQSVAASEESSSLDNPSQAPVTQSKLHENDVEETIPNQMSAPCSIVSQLPSKDDRRCLDATVATRVPENNDNIVIYIVDEALSMKTGVMAEPKSSQEACISNTATTPVTSSVTNETDAASPTKSAPRRKAGGKRKLSKQDPHIPLELFTRNQIDSSYGFSDEELDGWVPAPKVSSRHRRKSLTLSPQRLASPELNSPSRTERSCNLVPTNANTNPVAQPELPSSHQASTSPLLDSRPEIPPQGDLESDPEPPSREPEHGLLHHSYSPPLATVQPQMMPEEPGDDSGQETIPGALSIRDKSRRRPKEAYSAYLPRRTKDPSRLAPISPEKASPSQPEHASPETAHLPHATTPHNKPPRAATSVLSLIDNDDDDGSGEDELSAFLTPRSHSIAGGRYAGPARLTLNSLSSPIKKTPKTLGRRLFMTRGSASKLRPRASLSALPRTTQPITPLPRRSSVVIGGSGGGSGSSSVRRSRINQVPVRSVIETPGGSRRRCGEQGFRCDRDWCFFCIGD